MKSSETLFRRTRLGKIRTLFVLQMLAVLIGKWREKDVLAGADLDPFVAGQHQRVRRRLFA
jgi:hypothetical protein